ncbi:MAG: AAA family ATPase, partial [Candidatus Magnetoovum sp. WYHC-5]|nr:AAA family ATPase [Candidatus Magnetoovum sp. WYHC-5]
AFSPDSTLLASASSDDTVKIWNVRDGSLLRTLSDHREEVNFVAFSPDGTYIASASSDGTIKIWNVKDGSLLRTLSDHRKEVNSVAFSPDGTYIASASSDDTVKIWNVRDGSLLRTFNDHREEVNSVAFSPDGTLLVSASSDGTIKTWNVKDGSLLRIFSNHQDAIKFVVFSPDGTLLASASSDDTIKIWNLQDVSLTRTLSDHRDDVNSVAFSPDGTLLASASSDDTVKIWNVRDGSLLRTFNDHREDVNSVAFSPDGTLLASSSWDYTIKIWNLQTGILIHTLTGHQGPVYSVAFSRDGTLLASASSDMAIKIWSIRDGSLLHTLSDNQGEINSVAFSPNNTLLASACLDNAITIWNIRDNTILRRLTGYQGPITSITFSPDGTYIAFNNVSIITIIDTTTYALKRILTSLRGFEWLSFDNEHLTYSSSLQGDQYAAIRFNNSITDVYPLTYYQKELKRNNLTYTNHTLPIGPKPIKKWWNGLENKTEWIFGFSTGIIIMLIFLYIILKRRSDPLVIAKSFFPEAGYEIQLSSNKYLILNNDNLMMAYLWEDKDVKNINYIYKQIKKSTRIKKTKYLSLAKDKVYLIYKDKLPTKDNINNIKTTYNVAAIPIYSRTMEKSIIEKTCKNYLIELDNQYISKIDPYFDTNPINDPLWFFGRRDFIDNMPQIIVQGQHMCIYGLRKVGKTSLMNFIAYNFSRHPIVSIDCQRKEQTAKIYYKEILKQLTESLKFHGIKRLNSTNKINVTINEEEFRNQLLNMHDIWTKAGHSARFIIFFDEIDRLFVDRQIKDNEATLREYMQLFSVLRRIIQEKHFITLVVITYSADINRHNNLPSIGVNPVYNFFQEKPLGFLNTADSTEMITKIGLLKDITWGPDAVKRVFDYCGGHSYISRCFASIVCEQGALKHIDYSQVEKKAATITSSFAENQIGNYFKEVIWDNIRDEEKELLSLICKKGENGFSESEMPMNMSEAYANLRNFGIIVNKMSYKLFISSILLQRWLERRV